MAPLDDPRPFAEVLRDWMDRRGLSAYAAAKVVGAKRGRSVVDWLAGGSVTYEPAIRALMTMVDEGRLQSKKPAPGEPRAGMAMGMSVRR